jgi:hypothetical protein
MLKTTIVIGLFMFFAPSPSPAQQGMRDGRLGNTTSSGAASRAAISLDAKNNPELFKLSKKVPEGVSDLKQDLQAAQQLIPSLSINEFSQMKLASKEFQLKFVDLMKARQGSTDLQQALIRLKVNVDTSESRKRLANVQNTANTIAPPR